jgi:hypothetical protein
MRIPAFRRSRNFGAISNGAQFQENQNIADRAERLQINQLKDRFRADDEQR